MREYTYPNPSVTLSGSIKVSNVLIPVDYDSIVPDYSGLNADVYVYKTGGVSGITVATVTITYADATKAVISSVVRS